MVPKRTRSRVTCYWVECRRIGEARRLGPEAIDVWSIVIANRSGKGSFVDAVARLDDDVVMGQESMARTK